MGKPDLGRLIAQTMAQPAEERTIEVVTGDILEAQRKGGEAVLTIGRCLIEAKDMLRHGEWLPWLAEKVGYSEKTAQNFMRLAREFSNPQAIADLGATKALKLLALPADEREQFVADHNVIDMTTRQLEAAIKERDEARAHAQQAEQERSEAQQSAQKLQETLHDVLEDRSDAYQRLEKLTEELDELKARPVEVAVETVVDQEAIDKAKDEARAEMQAKLDKAKEEAAKAKRRQKEAEAAAKLAESQFQDAERARKNAVLSADEDMAAFKVLFNQSQDNANKMRGILLKFRARKDQAAAQGVEKALKALAEAIGRCTE
jgi:chromosome segregation ATPase